jgi:phosphoribosylaminoimidazole-succinocarboxamide synthase
MVVLLHKQTHYQKEGAMSGQILFEGDTKRIITSEEKYCVFVEANDSVFLEDRKKYLINNKSIFSNTTAGNLFVVLDHYDVPNHFIRIKSATSFLAQQLEPVPVNLVVSSRAMGNFLNRHSNKNFGDQLNGLNIDWFYKEDSSTNRYMKWNGNNALFDLYSDHKPVNNANFKRFLYLKDVNKDFFPCSVLEMQKYEELSIKAFKILSNAWASKNIELVQLRLSFGYNSDGELVIGDSINNDYMELWPNGDHTQSYGKTLGIKPNMIDKVIINILHQNYKNVSALSRFKL